MPNSIGDTPVFPEETSGYPPEPDVFFVLEPEFGNGERRGAKIIFNTLAGGKS